MVKTRCILCKEPMDEIVQERYINSDKYGTYTNLYCTECKKEDFEERLAALQRNERIRVAELTYRKIALDYEKTKHQEFIKWANNHIKTISKEYIGSEGIQEELQEYTKEVDLQLKAKEKQRQKIEEEILTLKKDLRYINKKQNNTNKDKEKAKKIRAKIRYKRDKHIELNKKKGDYKFPNEIKITYCG